MSNVDFFAQIATYGVPSLTVASLLLGLNTYLKRQKESRLRAVEEAEFARLQADGVRPSRIAFVMGLATEEEAEVVAKPAVAFLAPSEPLSTKKQAKPKKNKPDIQRKKAAPRKKQRRQVATTAPLPQVQAMAPFALQPARNLLHGPLFGICMRRMDH